VRIEDAEIAAPCNCERLDEDSICRRCGMDRRRG
jgi:hypothetical protein